MSGAGLAGAALLGAAGCGSGTEEGGAGTNGSLQSISMAIAAGLDTSPVFAGIDQGFYEEAELEVTPNVFTSGVELVRSVASGESQLTPLGGLATFSAVESGTPLRVIGIDHGDPTAELYSTSYMIAGPDAGIGPGEFEKLRGKKVGTPLGTDGEAALRALVEKAGLSQDAIQAINVAPPDMATALSTKQVDAIIFVEPWPTLVESKVEGAVRVSKTFAPYYSPGIFVTTEEQLSSRRDLLIDFLTAISRAQQWARKNKTGQLIDVNSRHTDIPEDVAKDAVQRINFDGRMSKLVVQRHIENTVPTYVAIGGLEEKVPIKKIFDTSLMKEVQTKNPDLFSDLPQIPSQYQL